MPDVSVHPDQMTNPSIHDRRPSELEREAQTIPSVTPAMFSDWFK
jgi:hypothetical protein